MKTILCILLATSLTVLGEISPSEIPFSQLGAKASKEYHGDGLRIERMIEGARLHTHFQKLAGTVTERGLILDSTDPSAQGRLSLRAVGFGRESSNMTSLTTTGDVIIGDKMVAWARPGLVEEFSVSVDGLRQDFVVLNAPSGTNHLCVDLALNGARAKNTVQGVKLTLDGSARELMYAKLHVSDAKGRQLSARMEAASDSRLRVVIEDGGAAYPVRVDPTFIDADWISLNPNLPGTYASPLGTIKAFALDGNGNLYVGGSFSAIGNVTANNIAKWNGNTWSAFGAGVDSEVYALAVSGEDLYVGGRFTNAGDLIQGNYVSANNIVKWNGIAWTPLGTGTNSYVYSLCVSGSDLYVGGVFTSAGGVTSNCVAKWSGTSWSSMESGVSGATSNAVNALTLLGGEIYAGGRFTTAGTVPANNIAKWNGSTWSPLSTGTGGTVPTVSALAVNAGELYAGGSFTTAGGTSANRIAKWNGSTWSAIGSGTSGSVLCMLAYGGDLYIGGTFISAGGVTVNRVAKWNGSAWSSMGTGINNAANALALYGGEVLVGGVYTAASGLPVQNIAKWNGSAWSPIGTGMDNKVNALAMIGSDLYVGGGFTMAGGASCRYIAKWNGTAWTTLGTGMNASVNALAVMGGELYAAGGFTTAGGVTVNRIAKWNGSTWSALGTGLNQNVYALAVNGSDLYVGGFFTNAGGVPANYIAKWNGSTWSALGTGLGLSVGSQYAVLALAVSGNDLYAGGDFTTAGGAAAKLVAKWNGSAWSAVGASDNQLNGNRVYALAVGGGYLYASGSLTATTGFMPINSIAKWDGVAWSDMGYDVFDPYPKTLLAIGSDLYTGSTSSSSGSQLIYKWNGSKWATINSAAVDANAFSGDVNALLADSSGHLFIGGSFFRVNNTFSPFLVQANLPTASPPTVTTPTSSGVTGIAAVIGGNVTTDGGAPITERGVVFATTASPLVIGRPNVSNAATAGSTGVFTVGIGPLRTGQFYSFAAYARNSAGTGYSDASSFTTSVSLLPNWRFESFGTSNNSGNAANTAIPQNDGIMNLMKFALNMNPKVPGVLPISSFMNSGTIEFTYTRSRAGAMECIYTIEWNDSLTGNWSTAGVNETILSDNGTVQQIKTTIPAGSSGARFVRLRVTTP